MGKINVLSFAVANLIAAGEVVDRPSSVIKELLENAIDSGATKISVEIQNGGVTYMRVADNGCGMSRDDLPIAIRRHATSKIKEADDLGAIMTLGFRGEALAAIAAVSDMRIISRREEDEMGAMLEASGGNILGVTERACAVGTTVIVEELFANVPARRKFLKKDITESMAVNAMVEKIALSRPDIAFKLIIDGNVKLQTEGDGNLKNAIYSLFGRDFASKLLEASIEIDGIKVKGFVGRPDNVRANRNYQNFFINGRYVKSKTALAAIEQAYTSYIASEKFPCCVLFITIEPSAVDVNVHPAKLEVKFSNERPVFEAIYYSVRNALENNTQRPDINIGAPSRTAIPKEAAQSSFASTPRVSDMRIPIEDTRRESLKARQLETPLPLQNTQPKENESSFLRLTASEFAKQYGAGSKTPTPAKNPVEPIGTQAPVVEPHPIPEASQPSIKTVVSEDSKPFSSTVVAKVPKTQIEPQGPKMTLGERTLSHRIVGEVFNSYVIVERGDTMLLIDKHAAHERIIFEGLKASMKQNSERASQLLMLPLEVMMTSAEIQTLEEYRSEIEAIGFEFSAGKYTVSVTAIPAGITTDAVTDMLTVMAERIKSSTGTVALTRELIFEKALYQASCKAAIKAGREYPPEYVEWIVEKLMQLPDITVCPHGRPVAMELSHSRLNNQFERT